MIRRVDVGVSFQGESEWSAHLNGPRVTADPDHRDRMFDEFSELIVVVGAGQPGEDVARQRRHGGDVGEDLAGS